LLRLVVGVQCGGSDAFSGFTANPAAGYCTDLLVRDGIAQLTKRASTPEVAQALIADGQASIEDMGWELHNALVLFNLAPVT
jgi:altronate dehydratase